MDSGIVNHDVDLQMTLRLVGSVFRGIMGVVIVAVAVLVSAGQPDWAVGGPLVGLYALWVAVAT